MEAGNCGGWSELLEKKTLLEVAKLNRLKPWQQEKHYVQAAMLEVLAEHPVVLKDGTYLWFFHGLPRFSEDLDFTAKEKLGENLPETVSRSLELFGIENSCKVINDGDASLSFRISAKGPLNTTHIDECRVYVEISRRERVLEKPLPVRLDFPAYLLPVKSIPGMSLEEVAAEKVRAILTRQQARDVFDLAYLIEEKGVSFNKKTVSEKLRYYRDTFSAESFMEKVREKESYYKKELANLLFSGEPEFTKALRTIRGWVCATGP